MTSNAQNKGVPADRITALPSLSCALSSLPQAKSIANVSLHPTMYAHRAAESEAKLKTALSKTANSFQPPNSVPLYMNPLPRESCSPNSSQPIMMRQSRSHRS
ncbi:hypothetical protein PLICRDRAFT_46790 [Plicaturopsis crispa FD-325 SS-3]|uniref:Uncharacterized protein n=1 Tax=Plicaturopsis crispa FD-325 SS-3 TaxID=944288 RepID=A0A0C9T766_PLICR|nr:hypothetical protein PLICRDRAFT_46790 [Plicaturopsis crispa FD-325 SS-3]